MNKHEHVADENASEQEDEMETTEDSCGCCCESDDISVKELAYHADDKIDALIQLLIKKNVITEHEFEEEYNSLFEEDEEKTE
jgi:hypothetical protein